MDKKPTEKQPTYNSQPLKLSDISLVSSFNSGTLPYEALIDFIKEGKLSIIKGIYSSENNLDKNIDLDIDIGNIDLDAGIKKTYKYNKKDLYFTDIAIENEQYEVANYFLQEKGAKISKEYKNDLLFALVEGKYNNLDLLKVIIKNKANIRQDDKTLLYIAIENYINAKEILNADKGKGLKKHSNEEKIVKSGLDIIGCLVKARADYELKSVNKSCLDLIIENEKLPEKELLEVVKALNNTSIKSKDTQKPEIPETISGVFDQTSNLHDCIKNKKYNIAKYIIENEMVDIGASELGKGTVIEFALSQYKVTNNMGKELLKKVIKALKDKNVQMSDEIKEEALNILSGQSSSCCTLF